MRFPGCHVGEARPRAVCPAHAFDTIDYPKATDMISRTLCLLALVATLLAGCASVPPGADYPKTVSTAFAQPEQTRLGRNFAPAAAKLAGKSGFRILTDGVEGFLARAQLIAAAERSLDVQYFIFRQDQTGRLLADAMLRAADRGVRVRVLIDDGDTVPGDARILALAAHPKIEIRVFNPFAYRGHAVSLRDFEFLLSGARLDYRMHNKLFVVDNAVALLGGRNIGDEYFQIDPMLQFGDDDVLAVGPVVRELSSTFDEFWNSSLAIPGPALANGEATEERLAALRHDLSEHRQSKKEQGIDYVGRIATGQPLAGMLSGALPLVWANATMVHDSPDKKGVVKGGVPGTLMHRPVADAATLVESELLMVTPFLIPGVEGMRLLKGLRGRGVTVGILTNSLETNPELLAHSGYVRYRRALLDAGVALYEVRARLGNTRGSGQTAAISRFGNYSLHAKLFVFDRKRVFIGSMNFDQRSMHLNTEVGLLIESVELARQTAARFESIARPENSYRVAFSAQDDRVAPRMVWQSIEDGKPVEYDAEPARSPEQRIKLRLLSILPLDSEL